MARKFEWRYANDESRIDGGNWFENWGDPLEERCLTLTSVVMATKDPVWCIQVHAQVIADLNETANTMLRDLDEAFPEAAQQGEAMVAVDSPLGSSLLRVHRSLTHAVALLVDALVECRKGRLEMTLYNNPALCGDVLFALAEATNLQFWITHRIRMPDD